MREFIGLLLLFSHSGVYCWALEPWALWKPGDTFAITVEFCPRDKLSPDKSKKTEPGIPNLLDRRDIRIVILAMEDVDGVTCQRLDFLVQRKEKNKKPPT